MIPHERSLVKKYADEPFALVGVNTDSDKEKYRKQAEEMQVTWRSAWQGSTGGAISRRWAVMGYPTVYLIDAEGKIRKQYVGSPDPEELERLIDELIAEAKDSG